MKRNNFRTQGVLLVFYVLFLVVACEKYVIEGPDRPENVSFKTDIVPIFEKNCISCHGGGISPNLKPDVAYSSIVSKNLVSTDEPETSKLYDKLVNSSSHQSKATAAEKLYILVWIEEGAKNN